MKNIKQIPRTCIATTWIWYGGLFMWIHLEIISTERVSRLDHIYIAFFAASLFGCWWLCLWFLGSTSTRFNGLMTPTKVYHIPPLLTTCLQTEISGLVAAYYNARLKLNTVFNLSLSLSLCGCELTYWNVFKSSLETQYIITKIFVGVNWLLKFLIQFQIAVLYNFY